VVVVDFEGLIVAVSIEDGDEETERRDEAEYVVVDVVVFELLILDVDVRVFCIVFVFNGEFDTDIEELDVLEALMVTLVVPEVVDVLVPLDDDV
jgi:hypothetical protein